MVENQYIERIKTAGTLSPKNAFDMTKMSKLKQTVKNFLTLSSPDKAAKELKLSIRRSHNRNAAMKT